MAALPVKTSARRAPADLILCSQDERKNLILYPVLIDRHSDFVAAGTSLKQKTGINFKIERFDRYGNLTERGVIFQDQNAVWMAELSEAVIASKQISFLGGSKPEQFRITDIFLEESIESQNTQVFGKLPEIIVAGETHRANLRHPIWRYNIFDRGRVQFSLDYGI